MDTEKILSYREKGVRIVLAIGGWASSGFSTSMRTESSRKVLIDSIMEALKNINLMELILTGNIQQAVLQE